MAEYSELETQRIKKAIGRTESFEMQKQIWDSLRDGAELIWDGDEIVGLVFPNDQGGRDASSLQR